MKHRLRVFSYILFFILSILLPFSYIDSAPYSLQVHFIDVGQGDATLVTYGAHAMMIDFGDNSKGTYLQKYLKDHNISTLDYAIGTHPDEDHIGGMDVILYKFNIECVMMPDKEAYTSTYRDVIDTCKEKGYSICHPSVGDTFVFGKAEFQILGPMGDYTSTNDASICLRLLYGDTSFLFTGDASRTPERKMAKSGYPLTSDVYKVAHHGSKFSSSKEFLKKVHPKYAVISCGKNNEYGHPHKAVINRLKEFGVKIYRTDKQGTIVAKSNGKKIQFSTTSSKNNTETDEKHTPDTIGNVTVDAEIRQYILNTNTHVFHYPDCNSVRQMKEKNKESVKWTREECISQGYKPCGNCHP